MGLYDQGRDFVGYGQDVPKVFWPDGARVAVNLVIGYEEGAEFSYSAAMGVQKRRPRSSTRRTSPTSILPPNRSFSTGAEPGSGVCFACSRSSSCSARCSAARLLTS